MVQCDDGELGLATGRMLFQCFCFSIFLYTHFQDLIAEDPQTHGGVFVPVILGSDKTTVSVATGQNEYYPLYGSIGNVHNTVRRAHRNALSLIGFLSIPKSKFVFYPVSKSKCSSIKKRTENSKIIPNSANSAENYSIHH
jgi:hypothetical protein